MKQIPIFRVTGIFLVLVFLCSVLFGCGGTGSAADDAYLTQVTASVTEAHSLIDEMISFSNEMTEATGTFSENKDSDAYVEQCRTKLTLLEEKVAVVQELQQQILEYGNQVGYDDEQTALAHPLGSGRVLGRKAIPKLHGLLLFSCCAAGLPAAC